MSATKTEQATQVLPISVGAVSEIGQREQNQDSMTAFSSAFGAVYLIADGMGGHHGGAEASRMAAEEFNRHLLAAPASAPARDAVTLAIRLANIEILEKGKSGNPDFEGMGSTVVIALVRQNGSHLELTTAHIGDSRVYLHRDGKLMQLTKDHTQVQWLIDSHAIDEAAARTHPDASVLTRALGHTTDLKVDVSDPTPLREGDAILLCSDGLSGFASPEEINRAILKNPDASECANQLVRLALDAGSNDNITVQFLRIGARQPTPTLPGRTAQAQDRAQVIRSRNSTHWMVIAAVLLLIAGQAAWIRFHRSPKPVVDPAIQDLSSRVKTLLDKSTALQTEAQKRKSEQEDLGDLGEFSRPAKKPAGLRARLQTLKSDSGPLQREFDDIWRKANELVVAARTDDSSLDNLKRPAPPGQKSADRLAAIEGLKISLGANEVELNKQRTKLDSAESNQQNLETTKSTLEDEWGAVPDAGKAAAPKKPQDTKDNDKPKGTHDNSKTPDGAPKDNTYPPNQAGGEVVQQMNVWTRIEVVAFH